MSAANEMAKLLRNLHQPGNPVVLANVYDTLSARAVAEANGTADDDMTMDINLGAVKGIAHVAKEFKKPLTVDIQDAYGEQLEETIARLVDMGVSGVNLEDCDKATQKMHSLETAVARIHRTLAVAKSKGIPDFVVNARCDTLIWGGTMDEVLHRGKAYLSAGATSVFVWGGSQRGVSRAEVVQMVEAFDGMLNVALKMAPGYLTVKELAEIGVCRISVGPTLQFMAMETFAKEAQKLLEGRA